MTLKSKYPAETRRVSGSVSVLSLEQLVAEIDRETNEIPGPDAVVPKTVEPGADHAVGPEGQAFNREQFIRFYLNDILLAIPLKSALEIGHRPVITPLPNLPDWLLGVSNVRGEIVSIVDLKIFLG